MRGEMEETGLPFFRRPETKVTIGHLADQRRVTVVVGAGSSAEVGLPLWGTLVERLLLRALSPSTGLAADDYSDDVREACRRALGDGGAMGAATMARAVLGDRFDEELRRCLYEWPEKWHWDRPGSTARAVASLFSVMSSQGETCEIATTNYDIKLEQALEEVLDRQVSPFCHDSEHPEGRQIVRHLHGVLTEDGEPEEVTLTEADYHAVHSSGLPWQEVYLRQRLQDSTVVFVGASLTDQHLLRYIFRYASPERPPIALLVEDLERSDPVDLPRAPVRADDLFSTLKQERWEYANLTALRADYPAQPAQFLREVANHKESDGATRYGLRLDSWYEETKVSRFGLSSEEAFKISQHTMQEILEEWRDAVIEDLEGAGYDLSDETLAVHLWCRTPDRLELGADREDDAHRPLSSLAMIGCSDRLWTDPRALDVRLVTQPSSRAAVDAFCWGTPQVQFPQGSPKWRWILATPVTLREDPTYKTLPIGAVTLVSDAPPEQSVLKTMGEGDIERLATIEDYLSTAAEDALTSSDGSD